MSATSAALHDRPLASPPGEAPPDAAEEEARGAARATSSLKPHEHRTGEEPEPQALVQLLPLAEVFEPGAVLQLSRGLTSASTTTAVSLLSAAQRSGESTAWIQAEGGSLFPPDLAESGVDLETLVVLHIPLGVAAHPPVRAGGVGTQVSAGTNTKANTSAVTSTHGLCRAAEILLRSGAFGFVVLDLSTPGSIPRESAWQSRLAALCRQHRARLLILTALPPARLARIQRQGPATSPHRGTSAPTDIEADASDLAADAHHPASLGPMIRLHLTPRRVAFPDGQFLVHHPVLKNKSGAPVHLADAQYRGPWGLR